MTTKKTVFQKIIEGEIPSEKVYEDEKFLAFLDIMPKAYGHTLLITKEPYVWMQDAPDELIGQIFVLAKKLMIAMKKSLVCDLVQVSVVGDEVPHFHIHLIPRMQNEKNLERSSYESQKVMQDYADKIRQAIEA